MANIIEQLDAGWRAVFEREMAKPYMSVLREFLKARKRDGVNIFPPDALWFNAFLKTPLTDVNVVIVGQDPYHGPGQAHGLSFSVPPGQPLPPSLKNIYKELYQSPADYPDGDLSPWAEQGVLLLNASLTVEQGQAASHAGKGWETFTAACLQAINEQCDPVVFLAWGRFAHKVCDTIDSGRHRVIRTSHPSPLGATKAGRDFVAFLGSDCFGEANRQLVAWGKPAVEWKR